MSNKPLIYYKSSSGLHIDKSLIADWIVKTPTRRNRMDRAGSAGLRIDEKYELKHRKKGILFIDNTENAYVFLPKELLDAPTPKDFSGVKASIFSYNVNEVVNKHNLEIIPIPHEDKIEEPFNLGLSGEIRKRFGL